MTGKRYFEVLALYGVGNLTQFDTDEAGDVLRRAAKSQLILKQSCERIYNAILGIQNNSELTTQGKQNQAKKVGQDAAILTEIGRGIEMGLNPIISAYRQYKQQFDAFLSLDNKPESVLRRMELRSGIERIEEGQKRLAVLERAVAAGDREIVATFFDKAELFQLIPSDKIRELTFKYVEIQNPGLAKNLQDAEMAAQILVGQYGRLLTDLSAWTGLNPEQIEALKAKLPADLLNLTWTDEERMVAAGGSNLTISIQHTLKA